MSHRCCTYLYVKHHTAADKTSVRLWVNFFRDGNPPLAERVPDQTAVAAGWGPSEAGARAGVGDFRVLVMFRLVVAVFL